MILLYFKNINKQIDTCHLQNQIDIQIRDIRFAFVSYNIYARIRIQIKLW
jgi:hypothetical protein